MAAAALEAERARARRASEAAEDALRSAREEAATEKASAQQAQQREQEALDLYHSMLHDFCYGLSVRSQARVYRADELSGPPA